MGTDNLPCSEPLTRERERESESLVRKLGLEMRIAKQKEFYKVLLFYFS